MNDLVQLSPEVAAARADGRPVVALESTIIAHGMPWLRNLAARSGRWASPAASS